MSNENAERLARALGALKYVEPIQWEGNAVSVQVLSRVSKGHGVRWSKVVESILLGELDAKERGEGWESHICRLYLLKERRLVYGWLTVITSERLEESIEEVVRIIRGFAPEILRPSPIRESMPQPPVVGGKKTKPRTDSLGYPIVPDDQKVWEQPMSGLTPGQDRNTPTSGGKGAYGMYKSNRLGNPFRAPQGGGKVGG